jgi:hypothetical protein
MVIMVMNATDQVFPSGVVPWAAVMIWAICLAMWGTGLWILIDVGPNPGGIVGAALFFLIGAATLGFIYRTRYTISPTQLIIQSGVLRKRIELDRISSVTGKLTPGLNFAMSRENILQVNIRDSQLGYRISPADRVGFMKALEQACSQLEHSEGQLVTRG